MSISSIILLFIIVTLALCIVLPLLAFKNAIVRRIIKLLLVFSVFFLCYRHIDNSYTVTPYIPSNNPAVYITNSGSHYHVKDCGYLWHSSIPTTLYDVTLSRHSACSQCNPPKYDQTTISSILSSLKDNRPAIDEFLLSHSYIIASIVIGLFIYICFRFDLFDTPKERGFPYFSKFIKYMCILYGIEFFPGVVIVFIIGYTLLSVGTLLYVPIEKLIKSIGTRKKK